MIEPAAVSATVAAVILVLYRYRREVSAIIRACSYAWHHPECIDGEGKTRRRSLEQ